MLHVGLGGHLGPAARLGAALARQGHEVLAWGPEANREQIQARGVRFHRHEPLVVNNEFLSLPEFAANLADAAAGCLPDVIEQLFVNDVDIVVHDVHVPWARIAADFLGIPRVVSNPLFPGTDPAAPVMNPMLWQRTADLPRSESIAAGMKAFRRRQEALERLDENRLAIARAWGMDLGDWRAALTSSGETTVSYTTPEITGITAVPTGWCYAGPLLGPAPSTARPTRRPSVYVAFGTYFNATPVVFKVAIEALAHEPVDVLVSTGRSKVSAASLEPLPANVVVRDFVPAREVLARAQVHITHGGCSSMHESLLAGVPMVCIPLGSDQSSWAQRVHELGAGEVVEMRPAAIRAAVRRLVDDPGPSRRARVLGQNLRSYDGEMRIAELIEQVAGGRAPQQSLHA